MANWLLIGYLSFDVGYGCDESGWLMGLYDSKEGAEADMERFKQSNELLLDRDGDRFYAIDDWKYEHPARYSQLSYHVEEFIGKPIMIGNGNYLE